MAVDRICKTCGEGFKVKPFRIRRGGGKFCSRACHYIAMRTGKEVNCHTCGKKTYKTPRRLKIAKLKKYFCNKSCQTKWRNTLFVGPKHASWRHGRSAYQSVLRRVGREPICQLCNNNDERVLATHHIDRDRLNNKPENLAWLCHNCHFLVHHYDIGREEGLLKLKS